MENFDPLIVALNVPRMRTLPGRTGQRVREICEMLRITPHGNQCLQGKVITDSSARDQDSSFIPINFRVCWNSVDDGGRGIVNTATAIENSARCAK